MKTTIRISAIAAVLAAGVSVASAQTAVPYGASGPMAAPYSYEPYSYEGGPVGGWNGPSDFRSGFSDTNFWATPGTQEQRDIEAQGNG